MKSINHIFKTNAHFGHLWSLLFVMIFLCFASSNVSAQNNESEFLADVTVDYSNATGIASITIPVHDDDGSNQSNYLRVLNITMNPPSGGLAIEANIWSDFVNPNNCSSANTLTAYGRTWRYCQLGANSTLVLEAGTGFEMFMKLTIPDLDASWFGAPITFDMIGYYDLTCCEHLVPPYNVSSAGVPGLTYFIDDSKSWNNGTASATIGTLPGNVNASNSLSDCQKAEVTWTNGTLPMGAAGTLSYDMYRDGVFQENDAGTPWLDPETLIPGQEYDYEIKSRWTLPPWNGTNSRVDVSDQFSDIGDVTIEQPNGKIIVNVNTLGGIPVDGVTCKAKLLYKDSNPACSNISPPDSINMGMTDGMGMITANNIFYGHPDDSLTAYEITGVKNNNRITVDTVYLDDAVMSRTQTAYLIDSTSYVVYGQVTTDGGCGLDGAIITAEGDDPLNVGIIIPDTTELGGQYTLLLSSPDDYTFTSTYATESTIVIDTETRTIADSITNDVDIEYSKEDTIRGFVGGDCAAIYGPATINAYSYDINGDSCLIASTTSDAATGLYEMILPSQPMNIIVENYMPSTGALTGQTLSMSREVELDSTNVIDFIFLAPIQISTIGLPDMLCSDVPFPILDQFRPYPLIYVVSEGIGCLIDTGYVTIIDEIRSFDGNVVTKTIPISNGIALDTLIPGIPNIFGNYSKTITLQAFGGTSGSISSNPFNITVVVTGASPRGTEFTTVSPQIPRIILRDPPGDGSYSSIELGESFSTSTSMYTQDSKGGSVWAKVKAGIKISLVDLEAGITIGGSIGGSATHTNSEETTYEFTTTTTFSTSDHTNINDRSGDVYVGAAMNLTYANADIISFDLASCQINKRVELVINPDSFATEFVYAESDIVDIIIPSLQTIVDDPSQSAVDRHRSQQGINVWHQVINLNAQLKEEAFAQQVTTNQSFGGSAGFIELTFTESSSKTKTIEWSQLIEENLAIEAGFEIAGSGVSGGFEVNLKQEFGESESSTTSSYATTTIYLDDASGGDLFTVDWAFDPVYGTPVFRAAQNAGRTSCPWEIGAKRDKPVFSIPNPIINVGSGLNSVETDFLLTNGSETNQVRDYKLKLISNPGGLSVKIKGVIAEEWLFENMVPLAQVTQNVEFIRSPTSSIFHFEGLLFKFVPLCEEAEQEAQRSISIKFKSPCSDIEMSAPTVNNGFLINQNSGNGINIGLSGYNYASMGPTDRVKLEYSALGSESWLPTNIDINKSGLTNNNPALTTTIWDIQNFPDSIRNASIRLKLTCNAGGVSTSTYSERVSGIIDRDSPKTLGVPEPADDNYESGDQIAIWLNESIDMTNVTVALRKQPENIVVPSTMNYVDSVLKLIINPSYDLSTEIGHSFDVTIAGIIDLYGNPMENDFTWNFTVGEIDSDGNGLTDSEQLCVGSSLNFYFNRVEVPHNNALNIVENGLDFTLEAWIFSENNTGEGTIISKTADISNPSGPSEFIFKTSTLGSSTKLQLDLSGEVGNSTSIIQFNGRWNHVAAVFDGGTKTVQFYIDGLPAGSHSYAGSFDTGNLDPLSIGNKGSTAGVDPFAGRLDDVIIWQHKLTQAEIMATMAGALSGTEPDLVAYYDFNEGTACQPNPGLTTAADKSSNNFDGTLINFGGSGCTQNWATERSMDNDRDGIPDGCDIIEPCFDLSDPGDADGDLLLDCVDLCPATKDVALDFDGNNDYVHYIDNNPTLVDSSFSFETWVNPEDDSEEMGLIFGRDASLSATYGLILRYQKIALVLVDPTTSTYAEYLYSITDVPVNKWSHVAVSFDAVTKQATFYLNGKSDGVRQSQVPSIYNPSVVNMRFGESWDSIGVRRLLDGRMDDVAIWKRSLSQGDVQRTMSAPLTGAEYRLEAYFDFNEGIACADNSAIGTVNNKKPGGINGMLDAFSMNTCSSNFVMGRNTDSNGNMIGDACDDITCSSEYVVYSTVDGWGSLREAIDCAPSGSTITFAPEIDSLPIHISSGEIVISGKSLVIQGNGARVTIIDGSQDLDDRMFQLTAGADVSFRDLTIQNGGSSSYTSLGGAIFTTNSNLVLTNCEFKNNQTNGTGGGCIWKHRGTAKAVNCVFDGNKALSGRAAIAYLQGGAQFPMSFQQCLFINNESVNLGACFFSDASPLDLINCTMTNSMTNSGQPVIYLQGAAACNMFNNIIYDNNGAPAITQNTATLNAGYNLVDVAGDIVIGSNGNFIGDPLFVNAGAGDYALQDASPAVNAGDKLLLPIDSCDIDNDMNLTEVIEWDLNGAPRVHLCAVDLGAYENQQTDCDPLDTDMDGIVDATDLCPDAKDTALDFDGIDDHVSVPHNAALNIGGGDFTFQAWVNPTAAAPNAILCKGTGTAGTDYILATHATSKMQFYYGSQWHIGTAQVPINQWSHLAVTFDYSTKEAIFYVNGVVDIVVSYNNPPNTTDTNPLFIGQQGYSFAGNHFPGRIDDVVIWNVAKSAAEINASMSYPLTGSEPGLVAHYNMNDGFACGDNTANTTAMDNSPNAFHGTLTNFDLSTNCGAGWSSGRNLDSDGDMIGDACDSEPCPPNLTLSGNQLSSATYKTDGDILTNQLISSPANIEYNSATSVELNYPFEIQLGATLTTKSDGCD